MNQFFKIAVMIAGLFLFGCSSNSKKSEPLELTILNKEFYAYCPAKECNSFESYKQNINSNKYKNIVSFKITNHSNDNYIFTPFSQGYDLGCSTLFDFPKSHSGLSLKSVLLYGSVDSTHYVTPMGRPSDYMLKTEEMVSNFLKSMNKDINNFSTIYSMFVNDNLIIIPAKSTMYFKTYFSLPYNKTYVFSTGEEIILDKNKEYTAALYFRATANDILKYLNEGTKKTLEQDNFKLFDGELISINQVPLIIKEN